MTTVEEWLGKDNTLGIDIWNKKYRHNNETFDEWLTRVSGGDMNVQRLILDKKFLFGGRILSNRGTDNAMTSNCFVLSVKDSLESIYDCAKNMAVTYKAGGGVGVDISSLAPSGAKVNNPAKTSTGAVSFIDLFTTTTGLIGQNGRRGALMVSMECSHPDIGNFIKLKTDVNKATTANLSIRVSDGFMEAIRDGVGTWGTAFARQETGELINKNYDLQELFKEFCDANYDYGEPGLLFWDEVKNYNLVNTYDDFRYAGVNPCLSGDMLILTKDGYFPIRDLVGQKVTIWNGYEWSEVMPRITGHNQPMTRVEFSNGSVIDCTDYHKFILANGNRVECKNLHIGDKLMKCEMPVIDAGADIDSKLAYTNGFYSGDGYFPHDKKAPRISLYGAKMSLADEFDCKNHTVAKKGDKIIVYLKKDGYMGAVWDKEFVPDITFSIKSRLDWLSGLIDSDGSQNDVGGSISISSISKSFLNDVRLMLTTLGVQSVVSLMKKADIRPMPDGKGGLKEYPCTDSYRLVISASSVAKLFNLGLNLKRVKINHLPNRSASRFITIKSLLKIEDEEVVYCLTEPKNHSMIVNGVITAQCGEEPLPDGGACLLGSMNLAEYVRTDGTFDDESFATDVHTAIHALNDAQDEGIKHLPLEIQRKTAKDWRQIGLGIMGLGDMLIRMNIRYGSPDSLELCDNIGYILACESINASKSIGRWLGSFDKFDSEKTGNSEFYVAHNEKGTYPIAMRNSQLLAIAPTGSISTMLGVSGGIEPLYALSFTRTTKSLDKEEKEYVVVPSVVQEAIEAGRTAGLVCASDIPYMERLKMQSIWQHHIDGAISSTVNIPENFPREDVGDIYLSAWDLGLKGVTIFREGCKRAGILNTSKKVIEPKSEELIGKKRKLMTGCGSLHCTAFFDKNTGELRETYLSKGSTGGCNNFMIGLSRMISLSARNGCDINQIVDQLHSCGACPSYAVRSAMHKDTSKGSCCPVAVGFALIEMHDEMLKEVEQGSVAVGVNSVKEEKKEVKNPCPQCGSELQFSNGCMSCSACGYSKCN